MRQIIFIAILFGIYNVKAQNIGIGTTTPFFKLHVVGPDAGSAGNTNVTVEAAPGVANASAILNLRTSNNIFTDLTRYGGASSSTFMGLNTNNLTRLYNNIGGLVLAAGGKNNLYLGTNTLVRMQIDSNGLIGVNSVPNAFAQISDSTTLQTGFYVQNTRTTTQAEGVVAKIQSTIGAAIVGSAAPALEVTAGYDVGSYGVVGLSGSTGTAGGFFSLSGNALRAKSLTGLALSTSGNLRFAGLGAASGKVLTSDASGNATWQSPSGGSSPWTVSGNNIYNSNSGNVGIDTTTPGAKLDVNGNIFGRTTYTTYNDNGFGPTVQQGLKIFSPNANDWLDLGYYSSGGGEYPTSLRFYSPDGVNFRNSNIRSFFQRVQGSNMKLSFYNNGSARFGGNVGIFPSTSNVDSRLPLAALEVDGNVAISNGLEGSRYFNFINTFPGITDWRIDYWSGGGGTLYFSSSTDNFTNSDDRALLDTGFYKFRVFGNALASAGTWVNSDAKLKKNVKDLTNATGIINQLKPYSYHFKADEYKALGLPAEKQFGFVAQEVEQVLPEIVHTDKQLVRKAVGGERVFEDIKSVNYIAMIAVLTKALQEQNERINKLEVKIAKYQQANIK